MGKPGTSGSSQAYHIDPELVRWATPKQREYVEAINLHGSARKAAIALKTSHQAICNSLNSLKCAAAQRGYSPEHDMTRTVPDPYVVKGTSTYYDKDGEVRGQWVKSTLDRERQAELMRAAADAMSEELTRLSPLKKPLVTKDELCNLYTLTDCHVGMLAWHKEGGADWDLRIAESILTGCFEQMVIGSPPAKVGIVSQLGDWMHYDGLQPVTPTNRYILDADGRFGKMVKVSVRILRRVIDLALMHHETVIVLMAEGNHDIASAVWLRNMFAALYEKEPRVRVIDSELPFYVHKHGNVMLGFHHGHLVKRESVSLLFAAQYPDIWGATKKRYIHMGHQHHKHEKEHPGVDVIQHPTLAAVGTLTQHAGAGYLSEMPHQ